MIDIDEHGKTLGIILLVVGLPTVIVGFFFLFTPSSNPPVLIAGCVASVIGFVLVRSE